jgi:hypothetical protein
MKKFTTRKKPTKKIEKCLCAIFSLRFYRRFVLSNKNGIYHLKYRGPYAPV